MILLEDVGVDDCAVLDAVAGVLPRVGGLGPFEGLERHVYRGVAVGVDAGLVAGVVNAANLFIELFLFEEHQAVVIGPDVGLAQICRPGGYAAVIG